MDLIIRNAKLMNQKQLMDVGIDRGKFVQIKPKLNLKGKQEIHANGHFLSPPLIDSHIHIDAALSANMLRENKQGSLEEAIAIWSDFKKDISIPTLRKRMKTVIHWLIAQGVQHIRAHTDVNEKEHIFLKELKQLKEDYRPYLDIQIVAFPQDGIYTSSENYDTFVQALHIGVDVIGGLPQAEGTKENGLRSLHTIFELAKAHKTLIDIHADETNDPHSTYTEAIAKLTIKHEMQGKVAVSHATAMHEYDDSYTSQLYDLLNEAKISIVTNPFSNALLQNRNTPYPRSRGTARIDELIENNINVSIGNDNVMDPFGPLGKGHIVEAALLLAHTAQLSHQDHLNRLYQMITYDAAQTLSLTEYGIQVGQDANCVLMQASDPSELIRLSSHCLYSIRHGQIIAQADPYEPTLFLHDRPHSVHFNHKHL